jgi:glucose-1-phosphate thymidylyltransferase
VCLARLAIVEIGMSRFSISNVFLFSLIIYRPTRRSDLGCFKGVSKDMKGVVLAGGKGSRLYPLTRVTNKHLLPVFDRPMIYYPIQTLVDAGIKDIIVVTGGQNAGEFLRLLSNGKDFELHRIHYTYQEGEGGIADALRLAEPFVEGEKICVILGDNIIENNIIASKEAFEKQSSGAHIILKEVPDPERFGCPEISGGEILQIEEKPENPKSNFAVTGIYFYDATVFAKIGKTRPSRRNELEITDVNNMYLEERTLTHSILDGWWTDAGTFESLLRATNMVAESGANKIPVRGVAPRYSRSSDS